MRRGYVGAPRAFRKLREVTQTQGADYQERTRVVRFDPEPVVPICPFAHKRASVQPRGPVHRVSRMRLSPKVTTVPPRVHAVLVSLPAIRTTRSSDRVRGG